MPRVIKAKLPPPDRSRGSAPPPQPIQQVPSEGFPTPPSGGRVASDSDHLCAVVFDRDKFSLAQARAWLKSHQMSVPKVKTHQNELHFNLKSLSSCDRLRKVTPKGQDGVKFIMSWDSDRDSSSSESDTGSPARGGAIHYKYLLKPGETLADVSDEEMARRQSPYTRGYSRGRGGSDRLIPPTMLRPLLCHLLNHVAETGVTGGGGEEVTHKSFERYLKSRPKEEMTGGFLPFLPAIIGAVPSIISGIKSLFGR